jgi:DNA polymerase III epsilon subunit-like protein
MAGSTTKKTKKSKFSTYVVFDTETTGLPANALASPRFSKAWPRLVQLGWIVFNTKYEPISNNSFIITQPAGKKIPKESIKFHGITDEIAKEKGIELGKVIRKFLRDVREADFLVAHNAEFDSRVIAAECHRLSLPDLLRQKKIYCTMKSTVDFCKLESTRKDKKYKWPQVPELYRHLFRKDPEGSLHDALVDSYYTSQCFTKLRKRHKNDIKWTESYVGNY